MREARDERYQVLLDDQREMRHGLHARQEAGLDNAPLFYLMEEGRLTAGRAEFHEAASETTATREQIERVEEVSSFNQPEDNRAGMKSGADISVGLGFSLISFFDGLADGLIGGTPPPKPRYVDTESSSRDPFDSVINETRKREGIERQLADEEEARRGQRSYGE